MKREPRRSARRPARRSPALDPLQRRIASLDSAHIDELYGLEPVYEPGAAGSSRLMPEEFVGVQCPYCGERLETRVDATQGELTYIEDCEVCCRPIELTVEREESGALSAVRVRRLD